VPAGEWVVLSARDRASGHTPVPVRLVGVVLGKFAGERLSAMLYILSNSGTSASSWSDLDACEAPDSTRLYEWKLPPSWQRQCITISYLSYYSPPSTMPHGLETRNSLQRMGGDASGSVLMTTLVFWDKSNGYLRVERMDWPSVVLGSDSGAPMEWHADVRSSTGPRAAYVKGLLAWANSYRRVAEAGFRREHRDADLDPNVLTSVSSFLNIGDFDPSTAVATR